MTQADPATQPEPDTEANQFFREHMKRMARLSCGGHGTRVMHAHAKAMQAFHDLFKARKGGNRPSETGRRPGPPGTPV